MAIWWSTTDAGLLAGLGGLVAGLSIGLLVTALRVLAPRGIGKTPVIIALYSVTFAGGATLGIGALAKIIDQPAHVWLPLVVGGGVLGLAGGAMLPIARLLYRRAAERPDARGVPE
jgi:hypothetical protein